MHENHQYGHLLIFKVDFHGKNLFYLSRLGLPPTRHDWGISNILNKVARMKYIYKILPVKVPVFSPYASNLSDKPTAKKEESFSSIGSIISID